MKVLQIHNYYRFRGGEDVVFDATCRILQEHGHLVIRYTKDSQDGAGTSQKAQAFFEGIYSPSAKREVAKLLRDERPNIVDIHNVHPFISYSVLNAAEEINVPIVLRCENYKLVCPIGTHLRHGEICDLCVGGHEFACIRHNCRGNLFESIAYAYRTVFARKVGSIKERVTCFAPVSAFVKQRLVDAGFPGDRMHVLPNAAFSLPDRPAAPSRREYVAFAGRISPEKGIATLVAAARATGLPVRLAGEIGEAHRDLVGDPPPNVRFMGHLSRDALVRFYQGARFHVMPSICYEGLPLAAVEAMSYAVPVIASRIGGLPEVVEDGVTGLLFEPGNSADLADKMLRLWRDPELCERMGRTARERAQREYGETAYYDRLMRIYQAATVQFAAKAAPERFPS